MKAPIFVGDEVTAAGFRLAGVEVRTPPLEEAVSMFEWARRNAELVLISAEYAAQMPATVLGCALAAPLPLVLVVPDARGHAAVPDLAGELRRQLGMEA